MTEATLQELAGPARPLSLVEMARVLGGLMHVERSAHGALGRRSVEPDGPAAFRLYCSRAALAHAWRAEQLAPLLPVSVGLPGRQELVAPPDSPVAAFAAAPAVFLEHAPELVRERLEGWYAVLSGAYERRLANPHPSADQPLRTVLSRVLSSLRDQHAEGWW